MTPNDIKRKLAKAFDVTGINAAAFALQRFTLSPFIRAVNYHDIKSNETDNFRRQLEWYRENFENVDEPRLRSFLAGKAWPHEKPGLIISFDDGMRSHFEIAAPMLEEFGFTGWFFVPAGWIAERIPNDQGVAEVVGDQKTLDLQALRSLAARHVIGSHTETHRRFFADVGEAELDYEISGSRSSFQDMLGKDVNIFCWVGGEEESYSRQASNLIRKHYDLGFMTNSAVVRPGTDPMQIQRTNIEAKDPLPLVRFQLSGFLDLYYYGKRRRVNRLTRPED